MNFTDFRKRIASDKAFGEKFKACKSLESLVEAAAKEGYSFTVDDINNNTDILPEELEAFSGGSSAITVSNWFVTVDYIVNP